MSLINEALRKARLEAARQDAARRGLSLPAGEQPARRLAPAPIVAAIVAVALAGGVLYWLGARSARDAPGGTVAASFEAAPGAGPAAPPPAPPATAGPGKPAAPGPPAEPAASPQPEAPGAPPAPTASPPRRASRRPPTPAAPPARTPAPAPAEPVAGPAAPPPAAAAAGSAEPSPAAPEVEPAAVVEPAAPPAQTAEPESFVGEAAIPGAGTLRLGGIAWSERQPFALINGRVVGTGDRVEGLRVVSVGRAEVVLRADGGATYRLRLR